MRVAVQARKVNLLSVDRRRGDTVWYEIPVDTHLQDFTVSISGPKPKVTVFDPNGKLVGMVLPYKR